jgi:hypothetical protein
MTTLYYPRRNNLFSYKSWMPHALFWVLVFTVYFIDFQDSRHNDLFALCLATLNVVLAVFISYAHYTWVEFTLDEKKLPHFILKKEKFKKKYLDGREVDESEWQLWKPQIYPMNITFPAYLFVAFLLISIDSYCYKHLGELIGKWVSVYYPYIKPALTSDGKQPDFFSFLSNIPEAMTVMYLFMGMRYALRHHELYIQKEHEKKQKTLEIIALRWQLEPHFLLSSLKNTQEAIEESKPEVAIKIIKKVKKMINYVVRECSYYQRDEDGNKTVKEGEVNLVPLTSEIDFINDFIELKILEKEHKSERIVFNIDKNEQNYCIVPMILICFVENAFKHGLDEDPRNGKIEINLRISRYGELVLQVFNTRLVNRFILPDGAIPKQEKHIGLNDTRALLDEVYTPNGYILTIKEDNAAAFYVELVIFKLKKAEK